MAKIERYNNSGDNVLGIDYTLIPVILIVTMLIICVACMVYYQGNHIVHGSIPIENFKNIKTVY